MIKLIKTDFEITNVLWNVKDKFVILNLGFRAYQQIHLVAHVSHNGTKFKAEEYTGEIE